MSEQVDQNIKEVRHALRHEKIRVLIWYVILVPLAYGSWIIINPSILETFSVYEIVANFANSYVVGSVFVINALITMIAYFRMNRSVMLVSSGMLLTLWLMFSVSFLVSSPPNTVWIFSALMVCLTFNMVRRV